MRYLVFVGGLFATMGLACSGHISGGDGTSTGGLTGATGSGGATSSAGGATSSAGSATTAADSNVAGSSVVASSSATPGTIGGSESSGGSVTSGGNSVVLEGGSGGMASSGGHVSTGGASSSGSGALSYCNGLLANYSCGKTMSSVNGVTRTNNVLLVLDQSGSMLNPASTESTSPKWVELQQALAAALGPVASTVNFGLELFPSTGDVLNPSETVTSDPAEACNVPSGSDPNSAVLVDVGSGSDHLETIMSTLQICSPAGGTPTGAALQQAMVYFTQGNGADLNGRNWVLLATDGGANCNPSLSCSAEMCTQNIDCRCGQQVSSGCAAANVVNCCASVGTSNYGYICLDAANTVFQISQLAAQGISTFVVGIPGSEAYASTLNEMAIDGGVPVEDANNGARYYSVSSSNFVNSLTSALSSIVTQIDNPCDIELQESPPDPTQVLVGIDCSMVPRVANSDADQDGFTIDYTRTPAHLVLTGSYCALARAQGSSSVDVFTGCVLSI